jgi:hypothetical protein
MNSSSVFGLARAGLIVAVVLTSVAAPAVADDLVPVKPQPRYWKGNIHTHTFWSDGDDFPEMVAEWYRTHDYNFLALTDHNVLSQGIRWRKEADLIKKAGDPNVVKKYLDRFGPDWVEIRGKGEDK